MNSGIVVSDEMISAGLHALGPCEFQSYQDETEVLGRVFVAMVKLWPDFTKD